MEEDFFWWTSFNCEMLVCVRMYIQCTVPKIEHNAEIIC